MRRMKEREKEREADARDRQREKEELEEIKRKLMEEGHPDPDAELAKVKVFPKAEFLLQGYIFFFSCILWKT